MVILEVGRWLLATASALAWLLLLDAMALAWPHRDRSDRVFLLFVMVTITWATVFESNQAWYRYGAAPIELAAMTVTVFVWLALGASWLEHRVSSPDPIDGD